ncbi:MAG: hypothetical protein H6822_08635 [Planctomycetaceae bacterium]|nr:hypothetical protein [Planctomycetales bacterium]MCB9922235.1 hypothetical protein [Planctomycetaceae bacterium]
MTPSATNSVLTDSCPSGQYPALAALRLDNNDLEALSHQGFICRERRGDRVYHKLRFRRNGKQVVRYIGSAERATVVEREVSALQSEATAFRELNAAVKIANKMLRDSKTQLEPMLASYGYEFHGRSIRRPRKRLDDAPVTKNQGTIQ